MADYTEVAFVLSTNGGYETVSRFVDGRITADGADQTTLAREQFDLDCKTDLPRFKGMVMNGNPSLAGDIIDETNHTCEIKYDVAGLKMDLTLGDLVVEYLWDSSADTVTITRPASIDIQWRSWLLWNKHIEHFIDSIAEYR